MAKHHYVPATYLAGFSNNLNKKRRRASLVWVGDKRDKRIFQTSVESICAINDYYKLPKYTKDPDIQEKTWGGYEGKLADCIDAMITHRLTARDWIRVMVPFVTSMIIRTESFIRRFNDYIPKDFLDSSGLNQEDNTASARIMELQRLLPSVIVAEWTVIPAKQELITNDDPIIPMYHVHHKGYGFGIPLTKHNYLGVVPSSKYEVFAVEKNFSLKPNIKYSDEPIMDQITFNSLLNKKAKRFIIGSSKSLVSRYLKSTQPYKEPEPEMMGFLPHTQARNNEALWYHIATLVDNPIDYLTSGEINWETISKGWHPGIVLLPTNTISVGGYIEHQKDSIHVALNTENKIYFVN